jgi:protein tyrosine phosphatase (PTP) superfamily phosphohydrolase (DUF442 family)
MEWELRSAAGYSPADLAAMDSQFQSSGGMQMPSRPLSRRSLFPLLLLLASATAPVRAATPADTAGQPLERHFTVLRKAGYHTVVDLRAPEEPRGFDEVRAAKASGLRYISIPVTHESLGATQFTAFRKVMNDSHQRPVLVHCASANRVGAVMIPWLVLDRGMGLDEAVRDAKAIGLRSPELEAKAREYLSTQPRH